MAQFWWYVARSGGLVAWALLGASVVWGLALSTKVFGKRPRPVWLLDLHQWLGTLTMIFIGLHVAGLVLDSYTHFGISAVLVPFAATWHPVAVAWGVIALYLLAAVELTALARRWLPKRVWRSVHYLSFPVFVLATVHGVSAGTDSRGTIAISAVVLVVAVVGMLSFVRLDQASQTADEPPRPSHRSPSATRHAAPVTPAARPPRAGVPIAASASPPPPPGPRRRVAAPPPHYRPPPPPAPPPPSAPRQSHPAPPPPPQWAEPQRTWAERPQRSGRSGF